MIIALLLLLWCPSIAQAWDSYLYGGVGQSMTSLNDKPGLWRMEGMPYSTDLNETAFKGGIGVEAGRWFVEAGYVDLGAPAIKSWFVKDDEYDPGARRCKRNCDQLNHLDIVDEMRGGEAVVGYRHAVGPIVPYVKAGMAGFAHVISGNYKPHRGRWYELNPDHNFQQNLDGLIIAAAVGGGVCTRTWVELCGDVTYYHFIAHTANPLTDSAIVPTAYIKIPLGW